jgi:hypothetical protein
MKVRVYVIDLELPRVLKPWALRVGVPALVIAGALAVAHAAVPKTWTAGEPLKAADLNQNFSKLDERLSALEAARSTLGGRTIARITQCESYGTPETSNGQYWHMWIASDCDKGLPAGSCIGFLSHAQDCGSNNSWRVLLPGEPAFGPVPIATTGGMSWYNETHCPSTHIRAVYMCDR